MQNFLEKFLTRNIPRVSRFIPHSIYIENGEKSKSRIVFFKGDCIQNINLHTTSKIEYNKQAERGDAFTLYKSKAIEAVNA